MENQQHDTELDTLGGEPLDGSGFEGEQPTSEDEIVFATSSDEQKGGSVVSSPATTDQTQSAEQHNRDHRQQVTDSIISLLEQGVAPWQKPWEGIGIPLNPTTGKAYRGGNAVHLMATALQRGYGDPRWMTYKQAAENDWQVKKGEKGTQIEFWEVKDPTREKTEPGQASDETPEKPERRFIHKIYTVFNAQQIDGIPPHVPKERNPFEAVEAGERILASSGANISHDQADRAFYNQGPTASTYRPGKLSTMLPGTTELPFTNCLIGPGILRG